MIRTVLAVAKSAIIDNVMPPPNPIAWSATSANGAAERPNSSQFKMRTTDNATRT